MPGTWLVDGKDLPQKSRVHLENVFLKELIGRAIHPGCAQAATQEWPGLPRGVKFDPSDQEIIWHLLAKVGVGNLKSHPFIDEFIPTVLSDDGICYTHPRNLPGVKQDGSSSHLFHRAIKAYNCGTQKRRKIHDDDFGDVCWHKTGKTTPVFLDGVQKKCKKIMVLYTSIVKGGKAEKTSWVMHQYHLGTEEDEKEGEFKVSKIFCQQQQAKQSVTPDPPCTERSLEFERGKESICLDTNVQEFGSQESFVAWGGDKVID